MTAPRLDSRAGVRPAPRRVSIGGLREWMDSHGENDPVSVADGEVIDYASLIVEDGSHIALGADLLDLIFVGD